MNTDGGFRCECNSGFQLNSDQSTCAGIQVDALKLGILLIDFILY